ncbi:MAG: HDOD domain-containing protein [Nitrospirota bacterium]|nr:HDOD domain-containing protein [Nitrospirota bacterium]
MKQVTLEALVKDTRDIPALPIIVTKILSLIDSADSSVRQVSDLVMTDQSLVAKILKMANSAYYGRSKEITTVQNAINLLGFKALKEIVLSAGMAGLYNRSLDGYGLEKGLLWKHSLSTAIAAGIIARKVRYPEPEEAYIGGLLHDVGKLIVDQHMKGVVKEILNKAQSDQIAFIVAEKEVLGYDHTEVGGLVAEKWNLPANLIEVIRGHHIPEQSTLNPRLTAIVHLANCLVLTLGIGLGYEGLQVEIHESAAEILELEERDLEEFLAMLVELISNENIFKL